MPREVTVFLSGFHMGWASLCQLDELVPGEGHLAEVDGFKLAVFLDGGQVYVLDNECPHAKGSLGHGHVDRGCAVCPLHAWAFRLTDGSMRDNPGVRIRTYPTRLKTLPDGRVLVQAELPLP